jgi:hypothetical protein
MEDSALNPKEIIRINRDALNAACKLNLSKNGRFYRFFYESLDIRFKLKKGVASRMCKLYKRTGDVVEEKCIEDLNGFDKRLKRKGEKRGPQGLFDEGGVLQHHYNLIGQTFVNRVCKPTAQAIHFELIYKYHFKMSVQTTRSHLKKRLKAQSRTLQYVLQCKEDRECLFNKIDKTYTPLPSPLYYPYRPDLSDLGASGRVEVLLWEGIHPPVAPAAPSYKAHMSFIDPFLYALPSTFGFVNALGPADLFAYYAQLVPLPEEDVVVVPALDGEFLSGLYDGEGGGHVMDTELVASLESSLPVVRKRKVASVLEGVEQRIRQRRKMRDAIHNDESESDIDSDADSNPDEPQDGIESEVEEEEEGDDVNMDGNDGSVIQEEGDVLDASGNVINEYDSRYIDNTQYEDHGYLIPQSLFDYSKKKKT